MLGKDYTIDQRGPKSMTIAVQVTNQLCVTQLQSCVEVTLCLKTVVKGIACTYKNPTCLIEQCITHPSLTLWLKTWYQNTDHDTVFQIVNKVFVLRIHARIYEWLNEAPVDIALLEELLLGDYKGTKSTYGDYPLLEFRL